MPTDAQPMPRPTRSGLKVLAVGLLMLAPLWYVLSIGPVYHLSMGDGWMEYDQANRLKTFYAPVWWAANRWARVGRVVLWYTDMEETIVVR